MVWWETILVPFNLSFSFYWGKWHWLFMEYNDILLSFPVQPLCRNLKPSLSFHVDEETFFDCVVHYHGNKPPLLLWKHDEQELSSKANRHNSTCVISTLSFRADIKYNGYRFQCLIEYPSAKFYSTCQTNPPLQILCK